MAGFARSIYPANHASASLIFLILFFLSSTEIDITVPFSEEDQGKDFYLNVWQLSSISGPTNYRPIAIDVNGQTILDHFNPQRDGWRFDHFLLPSDLLKIGKNTIRIRLQDAVTVYWIESLSITEQAPKKITQTDDPNLPQFSKDLAGH